jgi:hypothetical protein
MGADIHIYLERWTNVYNNNCPRLKTKSKIRDEKISTILDVDTPVVYRWESCDDWYFEEGFWENFEIWGGRNYDLFSFLANVRSCGDIEPLDEPRGVPKDASDSYLWACNSWGGGAHSHSWFLLEELLSVDEKIWKEIYATDFHEKLLEISGEPSEIRVCFFFDS